MKILCPIDHTAASLNGLQYAVILSNELHAELHIVNVYNLSELSSAASLLIDEKNKELNRKMAKVLAGIVPLINEDNLPVSHVIFGSPELEILKYVKDHSIDLMVISTEGKKNVQNFIFGSTSQLVCENINIPVIVVPQNFKAHNLNKVLLAVDSTEIMNNSFLESPLLLAKTFDTKIDLIHVVKEDHNPLPFDPFVFEYMKGFVGDIHVKEGKSILKTINDFAELRNYDLIVMLKQDHNFFHKLIFESKAIKEILVSNIPVMITQYSE